MYPATSSAISRAQSLSPKISWIITTTGALSLTSGYTTQACSLRPLASVMVTYSPCRGLLSSAALAHACAEHDTQHQPIRATTPIANNFVNRIMPQSLRCNPTSLQYLNAFGVWTTPLPRDSPPDRPRWERDTARPCWP